MAEVLQFWLSNTVRNGWQQPQEEALENESKRQNILSPAPWLLCLSVWLPWTIMRNHCVLIKDSFRSLVLWIPKTSPGNTKTLQRSKECYCRGPTPHIMPSVLNDGSPHIKYSFTDDKIFWKYFYDFALEIGWLQVTDLTYSWLFIYQQLS